MRSVALVVGMVGPAFVIAFIYQLGLQSTATISILLFTQMSGLFIPCKKRCASKKIPHECCHFRVNEPPVIRVPRCERGLVPDIDILWGFDQVKWWQMGPNEGCHLVCSPLGLGKRKGGRATNTERTTLQCYCSIGERERESEREGLTPLVLIKRVSSEWSSGLRMRQGTIRRRRRTRINNAAILIPMLGKREGTLNVVPSCWFSV